MAFKIKKAVYDQMIQASGEALPLEACGLLAGRDDYAVKFYELTNAEASPEQYRMLPQEQFTAIKDMREQGIRMLAIWHSHPLTPARMSEKDLRLAFTPDVVYVIVSVAERMAPTVKGFEVKNGLSAEIKVVVA